MRHSVGKHQGKKRPGQFRKAAKQAVEHSYAAQPASVSHRPKLSNLWRQAHKPVWL